MGWVCSSEAVSGSQEPNYLIFLIAGRPQVTSRKSGIPPSTMIFQLLSSSMTPKEAHRQPLALLQVLTSPGAQPDLSSASDQ